MAVAIRQIHPLFVGEVSGIDLGQPLTPHEVAALDAGERQVRDMRRATVAGDAPTVEQVRAA